MSCQATPCRPAWNDKTRWAGKGWPEILCSIVGSNVNVFQEGTQHIPVQSTQVNNNTLFSLDLWIKLLPGLVFRLHSTEL